jgi:hypothetical protein
MIGPTILQGPHHAAQKIYITGLSDFKTTSSKVASVIANAIISLFNVYCFIKNKTVPKLEIKNKLTLFGISFVINVL